MNTEVLRDYIVRANEKGFFNWLTDKQFLCLMYWARMDKRLNLKNPQTFNEKLQWLKLYDRRPAYTTMVDKYEVKKYVADRIGEEYIIPTLGVWDRFEDIDFDALPDQFVLKCTHDSGGLVICRDKRKLDIAAVGEKIKRSLNTNYYYHGREWPYRNVKPRIIAEKYMRDGGKLHLPVYKFLIFGGEPQIIQVIQNDKTESETIDYFDTNWNFLYLRQNYPNSQKLPQKPERLAQMLDIAKKLGNNMPIIRVDLYEVDHKIYFSEYTFYSDGGFAPFSPEEWDWKLGKMIDLPQVESV